MKRIYNKYYLEKTKSFLERTFNAPFNVEDIIKNRFIPRYIKKKFLATRVQDFARLATYFKSINKEEDFVKEFFPIKYEEVINQYNEHVDFSSCQFGYKTDQGKICWYYAKYDRTFLKRLTQEEFTKHVLKLYRKYIHQVNMSYLQFNGYFLDEENNFITDRSISRDGKFRRVAPSDPEIWICF